MQARLITIPFSHYCEKARWVLDATGVDYREESHAPMIHRRATRAVGAKTVPVLVHGDRVLRDSTEIAIYADNLAAPERRLIPADAAERARVLDLENEIDETLGVDARLIAYSYLLGDAETARTFVERGIKVRTRFAQAIVAWLFRGLIFRRYQVTAEGARHAENRVRDLFARLGETLERQPYAPRRGVGSLWPMSRSPRSRVRCSHRPNTPSPRARSAPRRPGLPRCVTNSKPRRRGVTSCACTASTAAPRIPPFARHDARQSVPPRGQRRA